MRAIPLAIVLILGLSFAALQAAAEEPYAVGDPLLPFELEDQHGELRALDENVKLLLFSRDMDGGDLLREAVAEVGAEGLEDLGAIYVADIHRMPGLVARFIAIPRMRDRPYPVLLDRDGKATARLPDVEGQVTVLELQGLSLRAVYHLDSVQGVKAMLGVKAKPADSLDD